MHQIAITRENEHLSIFDIDKYISQNITGTETLLNDAGVIFLDESTKQQDVKKAEKILIKNLRSKKKTMQYIAFCQLSISRANGTATRCVHDALEDYRSDKSNTIVVEKAQSQWF